MRNPKVITRSYLKPIQTRGEKMSVVLIGKVPLHEVETKELLPCPVEPATLRMQIFGAFKDSETWIPTGMPVAPTHTSLPSQKD